MTARFYRNFWKYPKDVSAYGDILLDAGHLSQTFYLVCTELGFGAFFTAVINSIQIEEILGLYAVSEGAVAISGCGRAECLLHYLSFIASLAAILLWSC